MFKVVLKTFAILAILFAMLYVGMNNTHLIDFNFPVATKTKPVHTSAALLFFGMFAVGLLAGAILTAGEGKGGGRRSSGSKEK